MNRVVALVQWVTGCMFRWLDIGLEDKKMTIVKKIIFYVSIIQSTPQQLRSQIQATLASPLRKTGGGPGQPQPTFGPVSCKLHFPCLKSHQHPHHIANAFIMIHHIQRDIRLDHSHLSLFLLSHKDFSLMKT